MTGNGGVPSAVGGLCKHAKAALDHIDRRRVKGAQEVKGDGWDWAAAKEHVATAKLERYLSVAEDDATMAMVEGAADSGVWPVYETETNHFVVRDGRTRTSEHDYACVKYDTGPTDKSSRRVTPRRNLMCRVRLRISRNVAVVMETVIAGETISTKKRVGPMTHIERGSILLTCQWRRP